MASASAGTVPVEKYQKLAQAYSEQKQKNAVLKEAVHELQQKEKEWAASESRPKAGRPSLEMQQQMARLMETAKEREVKLRTMAGEMDTVKFHNQQLSKRVEVLQDQVAVKENKGKKAKKQAAAATDEMATALQEELHRKIRENEQLHRSKIELRDKYEHDVGKLKTLLAAANKARDIASAAAEEAKQSLAEDRARLQGESSTLSEELSKLRDESAVEIRRLELQLNSTEVALETALKTAAGKLYFDDTTKCEFNEFNVPSFDPQRAPRIKEFHVQMLEHVRKFCGNFSNLLTYFEEAAATGAERGYKPLPVSYTRVLDGHATFIKPLERAFASYSDGTLLLESFNESFSGSFLAYFRRFSEQFQAVYTTSSDSQSGGIVAEAEANAAAAVTNITSGFDMLEKELQIIARKSTAAAHADALKSVGTAVDDISRSFAELEIQYSRKLDAEPSIGTVGPMIKTALAEVVRSSMDTATLLAGSSDILKTGGGYATRGVPPSASTSTSATPPVVLALQTRAKNYIKSLVRSSTEIEVSNAGPAATRWNFAGAQSAGGTGSQANDATDTDALREITALKARIASLEQEKERLALDVQLAQINSSGSRRRESFGSADDDDPDGDGDGVDGGSSTSHKGKSTGAGARTAVLNKIRGLNGKDETAVHKRYYEARIAALTSQLQFADSKAVAFHDECRATALRLEHSVYLQNKQAGEFKDVSSTINNLRADLELTKQSYETQIATMSDHIMHLNEQVQQGAKEQSSLQAQLANKSGRKKGSLW